MRSLIVTVGSTRFDALIEALAGDCERFKEMISLFQLEKIIIQYGKCAQLPLRRLQSIPNVRIVDYLPPDQMATELASATIVVAHGGAGTALEVLRSNQGKLERFVMVENPSLLDSHQGELIDGLIAMGCPVIKGNLDDLFGSVANAVPESFIVHESGKGMKKRLPEPNMSPLISILDRVFFSGKVSN